MEKVDVTTVITAHKEGLLAHKTMLSVLRAAKKLKEHNLSYEIIVHIDNGDETTKDYFARYKNDSNVRLYENTFGELSQSRNFAMGQARGEYVSCIDADDLCSENWLINSYNVVKGDKKTVARINYVITFGADRAVVTDNSDISPLKQRLYLMASNMYGSPLFCHKSVYENQQQRPNGGPYGSEDWQWTLDTMAQGVKHVVAPETIFFYRKDALSKDSLLSAQSGNRATLSPTEYLGFESVRHLDISSENVPQGGQVNPAPAGSTKAFIKERMYDALVYANTFKTYRTLKNKIRPQGDSTKVHLPDHIIQEWKNINKIEKVTFPSDYVLDRATKWMPNASIGARYVKFAQLLSRQPDTLFFVPWLIRGGADKVFINTANELHRIYPEWHIAFLQTYRHQSIWQDKLDNSIDFVDLATLLDGLHYEDKMAFMAMFITQNNIKRICIGNSRFAYDFAMRYKNLIRERNVCIYAFAFTESIDNDGRIGDYIHEHIPFMQDVTYRIVTDNTSMIEQLYDEHGIPKEKVYVHHQFLDNVFVAPEIKDHSPLRVLWASRVNGQKLPEVLRSVGEKLDANFTLDAYGQLENHYSRKFFEGSGVTYVRAFDGIDDLPTDQYDVFLYTSNADGMPNILLEIASKGLPIVTSDVGGVKDFIQDGKTGLLVRDCMNTDQYVAALDKMKSPELRKKLATNAQKLLSTTFDKASWEKGVRDIFDK